jgi:tetratricopeptide (TPR) repeat protein
MMARPMPRVRPSALVLAAFFVIGVAIAGAVSSRWTSRRDPGPVESPDFARLDAHMAKAEEHLSNHRLVAAYEEAKAAEAIAPRDALVQFVLGNIAYESLWKEAAERYYRQAATLDPGLTSAHANLALVLLDLGQSREAGEAARRALAVNPDAPFYQALLGRSLVQLGRPAEAVEILQRAVDQGVHPAETYLARARDLLGDGDSALRAFDAVLRRDPTDSQAHYWRSACLRRLGRAEESRKALREYRKHMRLSLGIARIREVLLVHDPDNVELRLELVRLLLEQGKAREAGAALERAERLRPSSADVRRLRARVTASERNAPGMAGPK